MADDRDALQTRIQSLITAGNLPCEDCVVTWYGDGRGRRCAACDRARTRTVPTQRSTPAMPCAV